ncbi:MAG TPA: hypothetical protein VKY36_07555, partial [Moheibacter sp.]|nr:hypothetical protein [Moheibacter sp.]
MMHFYFLKRISLSLFILPAFMWAQDCDMLPLNLNGLNADVIAEGTGGDADGKSTHSIDADSWFSCIYYAEDFVPLNPDNYPSAEDFGGGLPNDGFLTSASSGIEYQFADYTGNNAVLLRNSVTNSVTVSSDAPFAAEALYLAVLSSEGVHNVNVTINFADGSSQNSSFQAMDWYQTFPPSNYIYYGLGRLSRGTGTGAPLNAFLDFGIMTIFEHTISIDAENVGKEITTIDFDKELTGNNAATTVVFAITACEVPIIGGEDPCEDKTIMECGETYTHELIPDAGIWTNYTGVTWNYTGSEKVWEFTAPTTGEYIFEVDAGTQDADFFLMDACSNTANNLITNTLGYWTGDNPNETITLTEGVTYYLIADLYTSASSPTTVSVKVTCPDDEPDPEGPCEDKTIMECGETYTQELIPDAGVWTNYTGVTWNYTGSEKVWEF